MYTQYNINKCSVSEIVKSTCYLHTKGVTLNISEKFSSNNFLFLDITLENFKRYFKISCFLKCIGTNQCL